MAERSNEKSIQLRRSIEDRLQKARHVIQPALPKGVDFDTMAARAFLEIQSNRSLANAQPVSVFWAVVHAASLGLSIGRASEEAHIIPFKDHGTDKAQLVIGYKGLVKLAYQHPKIVGVNAQTVFEEDEFDADLGSHPEIRHVPELSSPCDRVVAAYCVIDVMNKGGHVGKIMQIMRLAEIEKVRKNSRGSDKATSPWNNWFEEMAKKTVLRRTLKIVPRSSDVDRAMEIENEYEDGVPQAGEEESEQTQARPQSRSGRVRQVVSQQAQGVQVVDGEMVDDDMPPDMD